MSSKYAKLTPVEHCLLRPNMYLGSTKQKTNKAAWLFLRGGIEKREVSWNPALLKMFDEVLSNSVDAATTNPKLNTINIHLNASTGELIITDNGGIPVHKSESLGGLYVPEAIFSEMFCGENFDDVEHTYKTGQNGLGVKLVNIFSKRFEVVTSDTKNRFYQVFEDNMSRRTKPKITKSKTHGTSIAWVPDYDRLETELAGGNFDKMVKRVHDVAACNPRLKIYLNGERIKYTSFKTYIAEYTSDFVYDKNEDWQVGIAASEDGFQHVSFVNTTETFSGGTHIDYIESQITRKIREFIQKKHKVDVKPAAIRNHLMLFVNARIINPRYPSQTKEDLITEARDFGTSFEISDKVINEVLKGNIIQSILDWVASKQRQEELAKLRKASKNNKNKKVTTHIKANSTKRNETILHLMEGACVDEKTKVIIWKDGILHEKTMKDVREGDSVWTHKHRPRKVLAVSRHIKSSVDIETSEFGTISISPNHKMMVYDKLNDAFEFVKSKNIESSRHMLVRNKIKDCSGLKKIDNIYRHSDGYVFVVGENEVWFSKSHRVLLYSCDNKVMEAVEAQHVLKENYLFPI